MVQGKNGIMLIKGGHVIDPLSGKEGAFDVLVEGDTIKAVDTPGSFKGGGGVEEINAAGCLVVPGLIDIHVHLREPGQEWKETILTGSKAAVAGGFTAVCCMPNTQPRIDNASVVELVLEKAKEADLCRVYPMGCITEDSQGKSLAPFMELHQAGCVAFTDDGHPVTNSQIMRRALEYTKMFGGVLAVHEEDLALSDGFSMNESMLSVKLGLRGMPEAAENVMIARDVELARLTGGRVHFCHVSNARAAVLIKRAKEDGIPVTAETVVHYVTLDDSAIEGYNTNAKMSMPLRSTDDVEGLLRAVEEGVIDSLASDHAPHEADCKNVEFDKASFGIIGLQTAVPLLLARVREGKLSLKRLIEALTVSPARCLNLEPNSVSAGKKADLTIIDPERKMRFTADKVLSKSKNTPFLGAELQGLAVKTIVGGRQVFDISELSN